jgi:hypothetical protein
MKIGEKTWHKGDEVTITSEPYMLYGGWFQDAVTECGKTVSLATKDQREATAQRAIDERKAQQEDFKKLHKKSK